jgi:tetratricopeptide (TPR) repeat protein
LYSEQAEPETALKYLNRALEIFTAENNVPSRAQVLNTIGNTRREMGEYGEAVEYLRESIRLKDSVGDRLGVATSLMNIGLAYSEQGRHAEALDCYGQVLTTFEDLRYTGPIASKLFLNLGYVCRDLGRDEEALDWFLKALANAGAIGQKRAIADAHSGCAEAYEALGDVRRALEQFKLFYEIDREIAGEQTNNRIKAFAIKREVEQANREKEAAIREAEVYRLKSENLELEMRLKNNELTMLAMNLTRKDELLGDIAERIDSLSRVDAMDTLREAIEGIAGEIRQGVHADGRWQTFEERFRLLHPGFVSTLTGHCRSLTPTEIKICSLLKIGLSSKEIADLLKVTGGNVDMHRSRIRKKLGLDSGTNLGSYLAAL